MNTGSLRTRVTLVTLGLLTVVLTLTTTIVTVSYGSSLQSEQRLRLIAAAQTVYKSGNSKDALVFAKGLALEGIATQFSTYPSTPSKDAHKSPPTVKSGVFYRSTRKNLVAMVVLANGEEVIFTASQSRTTLTISHLLWLEILISLGFVVLAALLVNWITKVALRPLRQVVTTATLIAAGDSSLRLNPSRTDTELGEMAATFDHMVDALEDAVTDARRAESSTRQFLADASHELRTPVAVIQANVENMLRDQPERPERDRKEVDLAAAASRLGRLIDDLLNIARLEGGADAPYEDFDLGDLAASVIADVQPRVGPITIALASEGALAHGDVAGISRVIRNLLDNALSVTAPDGSIDVSVRVVEDDVELRVVDGGPGISSADRDRIFERFVRLHNREDAGTGLGLAIARQIARQQGGDLTAEDVSTGASFLLRLPAKRR
ncbi:MAG TPA: HAMP domain-containing sensor histidine kinase [Acidimicrobiales bacterium]|jgi:signal transduction histidine kinase|nr:HAMP domain-containing sensor histidine kinase [Acidimicrobiales bacterium]